MTHAYDKVLSGIKGAGWESVPPGDRVLFWIFGSVAHPILRRPSRLVRASRSAFEAILSSLNTKAGLARAWPPSLRPEIESGIELPPETVLSAWAEPVNQEDLVKSIATLKYGSRRHLVCDAMLDRKRLTHLVSTSLYQGMWEGRFEEYDFFNALDQLVDEYGWFYCPLPELTEYDFLVVNGEKASVLQDIDCRTETKVIRFADDRAYWPE